MAFSPSALSKFLQTSGGNFFLELEISQGLELWVFCLWD